MPDLSLEPGKVLQPRKEKKWKNKRKEKLINTLKRVGFSL